MFFYKIMKDGHKVGVAKGKNKAFEFVQALLDRDQQPGVWGGMKCETDTCVYTIERDDNA